MGVKPNVVVVVVVIVVGTVTTAASCASRQHIDVPQYLRANPAKAAQPPYAVKLTDNDRTWNVWLPPVSGGYEVRIPIGRGDPLPGGSDKKGPSIVSQDSTEFRAAMARVNALFQRKSYDLALLEVTKLRSDFPDDAKLLAMQGTLHWKLGDKQKAQEAWEKAMELDPGNNAVLEMLEGLK
jgi:tetratricopeptide (TPR) repeat protein